MGQLIIKVEPNQNTYRLTIPGAPGIYLVILKDLTGMPLWNEKIINY